MREEPSEQFHLSYRNWYWHSAAAMWVASLRTCGIPGSLLHFFNWLAVSRKLLHILRAARRSMFSGSTSGVKLPTLVCIKALYDEKSSSSHPRNGESTLEPVEFCVLLLPARDWSSTYRIASSYWDTLDGTWEWGKDAEMMLRWSLLRSLFFPLSRSLLTLPSPSSSLCSRPITFISCSMCLEIVALSICEGTIVFG